MIHFLGKTSPEGHILLANQPRVYKRDKKKSHGSLVSKKQIKDLRRLLHATQALRLDFNTHNSYNNDRYGDSYRYCNSSTAEAETGGSLGLFGQCV